MDFPLGELMDEARCYGFLVGVLHADGLGCPRCGERERLGVHRRKRAPVLDYQCGNCGRVFNAWTGTLLQKTHMRSSEWVLLVRGICAGTPTAQLARELVRNRPNLLLLRHRIQKLAEQCRPSQPLVDAVVEADEAYQNAGEKRYSAPGPRRPAAAQSE
jgi:transposase-like protein